jgi:hypothetical protein
MSPASTMNPYVTDPSRIPSSDLYADVPLYGRYPPKPDDFRVDRQHVASQSPASIKYWASVVDLCNESLRIYPADDGGRDVFALGSVIVKSSHLHDTPEVDYSYADANEVHTISIAKSVLKDIRVPDIYFAGKVCILSWLTRPMTLTLLQIRGRQVLIQERLAGVTLGVAWPYLSRRQKTSFKKQAREILRRLHTVKPSDGYQLRSHVVQDPHILSNGRINPLEGNILFSEANTDPDMSFMHNDITPSNIIVDDDRIVGLVDWEMAGFIGWKTAGEIHRRIRTPQRESFANIILSEERLQDIMYWNGLYDGMSGI